MGRPYRHYDDSELFKLASRLEADAEYDPSRHTLKQLAMVEAEISEREYELEDF